MDWTTKQNLSVVIQNVSPKQRDSEDFKIGRLSNEHLATKIQKIIPFTIAQRKMKYLGINLTKKDLCAENYKTVIKRNQRESK